VAATDLWRADLPDLFHWAEWEDEEESVFYHQGSGETLLLNPLGAFVLKTVCNSEISTENLALKTAHHFELPMDAALIDGVALSLRIFQQKGLIYSDTSS